MENSMMLQQQQDGQQQNRQQQQAIYTPIYIYPTSTSMHGNNVLPQTFMQTSDKTAANEPTWGGQPAGMWGGTTDGLTTQMQSSATRPGTSIMGRSVGTGATNPSGLQRTNMQQGMVRIGPEQVGSMGNSQGQHWYVAGQDMPLANQASQPPSSSSSRKRTKACNGGLPLDHDPQQTWGGDTNQRLLTKEERRRLQLSQAAQRYRDKKRREKTSLLPEGEQDMVKYRRKKPLDANAQETKDEKRRRQICEAAHRYRLKKRRQKQQQQQHQQQQQQQQQPPSGIDPTSTNSVPDVAGAGTNLSGVVHIASSQGGGVEGVNAAESGVEAHLVNITSTSTAVVNMPAATDVDMSAPTLSHGSEDVDACHEHERHVISTTFDQHDHACAHVAEPTHGPDASVSYGHDTAAHDHLAATHDHVVATHDHVVAAHDHVHDHVVATHNHVAGALDHVTVVRDHVVATHDHVAHTHDHVTHAHDHVSVVHDDHVTISHDQVARTPEYGMYGEPVGMIVREGVVEDMMMSKQSNECLHVDLGVHSVGGGVDDVGGSVEGSSS